MTQVQDIMTDRVVVISADATIADALSLLLDHGISGLPVVGDEDLLQGVITEVDIIEAARIRGFVAFVDGHCRTGRHNRGSIIHGGHIDRGIAARSGIQIRNLAGGKRSIIDAHIVQQTIKIVSSTVSMFAKKRVRAQRV